MPNIHIQIYTQLQSIKTIPLARVLAKTLIINLNKVVVTKIPNPQKGTEIRSNNMQMKQTKPFSEPKLSHETFHFCVKGEKQRGNQIFL